MLLLECVFVYTRSYIRNAFRRIASQGDIHGGPKKRTPSFIFGITSVIEHRF